MPRALDALEHVGDIVQIQSRTYAAKVPDLRDERRPDRAAAGGGEPEPQRLVDDVFERPSSPARPRLQLVGHIPVERQRRAHITMLCAEHHDVNRGRCRLVTPGQPWLRGWASSHQQTSQFGSESGSPNTERPSCRLMNPALRACGGRSRSNPAGRGARRGELADALRDGPAVKARILRRMTKADQILNGVLHDLGLSRNDPARAYRQIATIVDRLTPQRPHKKPNPRPNTHRKHRQDQTPLFLIIRTD